MLLKKSPQKICRIEIRNNRITGANFLNRSCAFDARLESMLLGVPLKILFQQHRSRAEELHVTITGPLLPPEAVFKADITGGLRSAETGRRRTSALCWAYRRPEGIFPLHQTRPISHRPPGLRILPRQARASAARAPRPREPCRRSAHACSMVVIPTLTGDPHHHPRIGRGFRGDGILWAWQ